MLLFAQLAVLAGRHWSSTHLCLLIDVDVYLCICVCGEGGASVKAGNLQKWEHLDDLPLVVTLLLING